MPKPLLAWMLLKPYSDRLPVMAPANLNPLIGFTLTNRENPFLLMIKSGSSSLCYESNPADSSQAFQEGNLNQA
mgnify:CR=1 FL=1